jgi:hypothetical protein
MMKTMHYALFALSKWMRLQSHVAAALAPSTPAASTLLPMNKTQVEQVLDWMEANGYTPAEIQLAARDLDCLQEKK